MKVVVRFCEDKSKEIEIEIDENCDVKNVKLMIEKLTETNEKYTADYFHIFHRNIILDNDRMVKFYAIEENDEIYIGKIKHYLQIDDEIVELFVIGDNLSFEYVVVKRNDKISQLKLLINRIIPDLVTVWSFNGYEMKDDQIISDILIMNKFYKFLVGCRIINDLLYNYFKIHDRYLVSSYAKKQKISFWSLDLYDEKEILQLKEKLIELKNSLENREIIPKLNESLSNIPLPFIRSRYLFCMNTADEIWDICRDYWSNMIGQQCIHRFIRDIFRVELNEELLIYSNIDSNMENIIDAALDFSCGNENILINIISKSMAALLWKYDEMLGSLCDIWNESIDLISFNQVDYINGISENLISDIKTKFIIGYEDPLIYDEIRNECIDKYKQNMYNLLIDIDKEMKPNKTKSKATMNTKYINFMLTNQLDFKEIIKKSVGKILNFIQRYVGNKVIKNGHLEEILRNHIVCLLREYLNVTISRIDIIRHSTWNETEINEIVNKSIKRMFIRIALINYAEAKSGLCNVTTNMSYDENSLNDVMNEFLEKKIIKDEMMETLFGLLPGDVEFEKFMKNGIDRLISEQKFDYIHEDIMKESAKLFIDSKFSKSKFIEESVRQIFDSLFNNDKVYEVINKKNTFYSQNCDITNNIKQYMISSLIKDSRFQEIFKNKMIYRESWPIKYCHTSGSTELMELICESVLNRFKIESDISLRSILINALDKCINSLDDIFENPSYFMKFFRPLLASNQSDSYIDKILQVVSEEYLAAIKIKINNYDISLQIPVCQIKTNIQLKKAISAQTKIPKELIYMIKYGEDEISNDEENIGSICDYLITFVSSMENIEVLRKLERGAFGIVHLCEDKLSKYQFVIKKSRTSDINLNRDISINLQLQSSNNFTGFHGLYLYKQSFCIGMEYFSRGPLRSILNEDKHLSELNIARYSHQILIQIDKMHQDFIVHRDIKPDNVVIDKDNNARLIDFGLSKNIAGLTDKDILGKLKQYAPGTLRYMAPELIKSESYSEKVDIWSFGIMVVEMLTGKKPFDNMASFKAVIYVSSSEAINLNLPDKTSEELSEFIYSCLDKNPNKRPTAKQLLESTFIRRYVNKKNTIDA